MTNIYIKTFGCSLNAADSEAIAGLLARADFNLVGSAEESALIIINSCNVKSKTQSVFFSYLEDIRKLGRPIVIAGCIPKTIPARVSEFSLIGPNNINRIVEVVEETLNGNIVVALADEKIERLKLPKIRRNSIIEILPVSSGCLGSCAYCIVKKARGSLVSYSPAEIINHAKESIVAGVREIWITSQDTGCYGNDIKTSLPELLEQLCKLDGDFRIRVGMANPNWVKGYLSELIRAFKHPKIFKFLHIPLQSGNNDILKRMNRNYAKEDFMRIVSTFRAEIPAITIATDVICGFPGETKEQFMETYNLIKDIEPDVLNISRFSPRPHTQAFFMADQIEGGEIKERSRFMTTGFDWIALKRNKRWKNWEGNIIIDETGKNNTLVGRNFAYKPVIIEGAFKPGQNVKVKIVDTTKHDLRAEVIQ